METKVILALTQSPSDVTLSLLQDIIHDTGLSCLPHVPVATFKSGSTQDFVEKTKLISGSLKHNSVVGSVGELSKGTHSVMAKVSLDASELLEVLKGTDSVNVCTEFNLTLFNGETDKTNNVLNNLSKNEVLKGVTKIKLTHLLVISLEVNNEGLWKTFRGVGQCALGSTTFLRVSNFVNGTWEWPTTYRPLQVINPATRKHIHSVPASSKNEINSAVEAAKVAFPTWSSKTPSERAAYLRKIADVINTRLDELIKIEVLDNGKPVPEATEDIKDTAKCFNYYANLIIEKEKELDISVSDVDPHVDCHVRREPVGVCGLIIPWNYPLLMLAWKVAPCLAAGCTAVLKPSEYTPLNALEFGAICQEADLPPGVINIITGYGPDAGAPLSNHPDISKVAFTGSVPTGTKVAQDAANSLKRCSLELGGKSPIIVFPDADLDQALDWITVGIFINAGQVCSATSRLIVHEDIKQKLLDRLVQLAKQIKIGDGFAPGTKLGPIVNEVQYNKVLGYIHKGILEGATLLCGGPPKPDDQLLNSGYFVPPTIFDNVNPNMTIWKEEIFGPVLSIMTFKTTQEAINIANDSNYGLAAAVMTKDKQICSTVVKQLKAGIVWINCSQPTYVQLPWGGMKQSGVGRELGPWGLDNYLEVKQVTAWTDNVEKGWSWFV